MTIPSEDCGLKKGPWTPEEDRKLIDCIHKHGHGNWKELPKLAGLNRCGKSCRLRWTNYLRPDIKRGAFSDEEEALIIDLHSKLGNKWSTIASYLPGRTDNEIKNFWNTHLKKKLIQNGIDPVTHIPTTHLGSFLPMLPQFLGSKDPTWENVVRLQTDAARVAKMLLVGNILQLLNTSASRLPMEAFSNLSSESMSPMGVQLEGVDLKPEYNNLTSQLDFNGIPQTILQNAMGANAFMEVYSNEYGGSSTHAYTDYKLPDMVSASPDQTQNNTTIPTKLSKHSSTSMTFEDLGDLMDDEASNYYWKQIIDQASLPQ